MEDDLSYLDVGGEPEPQANEPEGTEPEVDEPEGTEPEVDEPEGTEPQAKDPDQEILDVQPRKKTANDRIRESREQVRTEREARIRVEAERDALLKYRAQPAPQVDNFAAQQVRQEKLSLMDPHERAIYLQSEELQSMRQQLMIADLKSQDRADKAEYEAKALVDPRYARLKDEVDKRLTDYRAKGINPSRQELFYLVLGERLANQKPKKDARTAATQRVAATTSKPLSGKTTSTSSSTGGDDLASLEARLRGKIIS